MSKIIVPQELQNQIINLYKQGKTRKDIRVTLNLPFGDSVIKRILQENGCIIRTNPGAQQGGRKKEEVSESDTQKIIDLYKQGYGLNYISRQMGKLFCADKVKRVLKDNGVQLRNFHQAINAKPDNEVDFRKYQVNDNYVFESHNGAWLLGFLAADGYLPITKGARNRITLSLARKDEKILYKIKEELQYTGPIYQYCSSNSFPASSLSFSSKKIRQNIEKYGIVNNKTFKIKSLPNELPEEYMIDYIRGYFDGDGSIIDDGERRVTISFTSANKSFLEDLGTYLYEHYGVRKPSVLPDHTAYKISWSSRKDVFTLGELFYNHKYLALERKQKHYFEILNLLRK